MKYKIGDEVTLFSLAKYDIVDIKGFWIFKRYKVRMKSNIPQLQHVASWVHERSLNWYERHI